MQAKYWVLASSMPRVFEVRQEQFFWVRGYKLAIRVNYFYKY